MGPQLQEGDLETQREPTEIKFSARDRLSLLTLPLMTLVVAASSYLLSSAGYDGTPIGLLRFVPSL